MNMLTVFNPFFRWWLRSGRYPWSRFRRGLFEARYLDTSLPAVTSLEEIKNCLGDVDWTTDSLLHLFDAISYPQTVWHKKKDDCDGFAVLASTLLRQWNPDSKPVLVTAMLWPMKRSHTVCAFYASADELWFFDNKTLRQGSYRTYAEIAEAVKGEHELICWDVADPVTLETIEFHQANH